MSRFTPDQLRQQIGVLKGQLVTAEGDTRAAVEALDLDAAIQASNRKDSLEKKIAYRERKLANLLKGTAT